MVAVLKPSKASGDDHQRPKLNSADPEAENRVLQVLIRRLGLSQTFGENMIFMLNRAGM